MVHTLTLVVGEIKQYNLHRCVGKLMSCFSGHTLLSQLQGTGCVHRQRF